MKKWLAGGAASGGSREPTRNRREGVSARRLRPMALWLLGSLAMVVGVFGTPAVQAATVLPPAVCPTNLDSCNANEAGGWLMPATAGNNSAKGIIHERA